MIIQGIWNLRDQMKAKGATLVLLTTAGALVPTELAQDMLVLDEPLPTAEELNKIVDQVFTDAKVPKPKPEQMLKAVDAIIGLAAFPAEQTVAMCLSLPDLKLRVALSLAPGHSDAIWAVKG
jgi:hypothetical protein